MEGNRASKLSEGRTPIADAGCQARRQLTVRGKPVGSFRKRINCVTAGFLAAALAFGGITASVCPGVASAAAAPASAQITSPGVAEELAVSCSPASLKAQPSYNETFVINIAKDQIKSMDTAFFKLGGLFYGMAVTKVGFTDGKLAVTIQGSPAVTHAYGSDMDNPAGTITVLSGALAQSSARVYTAQVEINYPRLIPESVSIEEKTQYEDTLKFTLSGDSFRKTPTAADVALSGGFSGMTVTSVKLSGKTLSIAISGSLNEDGGNGIVTLAASALKSGFSVDQVIQITEDAELVISAPITIEKPLSETITVDISGDYFADTLTPAMFTLGGALAGASVTKVEKDDNDLAVSLTVEDDSLLNTGKGTVTVSGQGTSTGRSVTGTVLVAKPSITAYYVDGESSAALGKHVFVVYCTGNDFEEYISPEDFAFSGAGKSLTVTDVTWLSGYHVQLTATGTLHKGCAFLTVNADAMGGIAEAKTAVEQVGSLKDLGIGAGAATDWLCGEDGSLSDMNGATGGFGLDDALDWGLGKLKSLVISKIEEGLNNGATTGLDYALRALGLTGPSVEEMLAEIQSSLTALDQKITAMTAQLSNEITQQGLNGRVQALQTSVSSIKGFYGTYQGLVQAIDSFRANNPGEDLSADLQKQLDAFIATLGTADIGGKVLSIADSMAGTASLPSLITGYYALYRKVYPFEHNAVSALMQLVREMTLAQAEGSLLYAEYCSYTGQTIALNSFTQQMDAKTAAQQNLLPTGYELNIHNVWGSESSYDIKVKCNADGKTYILVGDSFKMSDCVNKVTDAADGGTDEYYTSLWYYMDQDHGIMSAILRNRGISSNSSYAFTGADEIDSLFTCWTNLYKSQMPANTFLNLYAGDNGSSTWIYSNTDAEVSSPFMWYPYVKIENIQFFNTLDGTFFTNNTWHLYADIPDNTCKFILYVR